MKLDKSRTYNILKRQVYVSDEFKIVPIRDEDRYSIMQWRNEQMYHLRQHSLLTKEGQDQYFENVIAFLFEKEKPEQILFSYLKNEICIGYGGLVHINWMDKHAEISFIMNTELEKGEFELHWTQFLKMIKAVAFEELDLHKVFVYAFDLRPYLYDVLKKNDFFEDAILRDHCLHNGEFKNVVIHSTFKNQ